MPKVRPAKRRSRVNTGAGLTDAQIKARNETAHAAFLAARRASQRGFDQSKTKIRTSEGKDGKTLLRFSCSTLLNLARIVDVRY